MTKQFKLHEINRLRTLIAFAYGDQCHGGPNRKPEIEQLKQELKELQAMETDDEGGPSQPSPQGPPRVGAESSALD